MWLASVPAQAAVVFNLQEVGTDVVLSGSGTLNLAGLTKDSAFANRRGLVVPSYPMATVGGTSPVPVDLYQGITGSTGFGSGTGTVASSGSGDTFGFINLPPSNQFVFVPVGYVSGSLLSGSATFAGQTLLSPGATIGTYTWTWGSGATADSITLNVGSPITPVPEPSGYALALAGLGLLGFWGRRQKAQKRVAEAAAA
jgi:MYXO-CTERM domain-containing protein